MKESEAKTKWCPMVRQVNHQHEFGGNRTGMSENSVAWHHSLCIASDCMMWVITDNEYSPSTNKYDEGDNSTSYPAGYCGLAQRRL